MHLEARPQTRRWMRWVAISLASAALGATIGGGVGIISALPNGFALWLGAVASAIGALTGVVSFAGGSIAYAALRRSGRVSVSFRFLVSASASLSGALVVGVMLTALNALYTGLVVAGTAVVTAAIVFIAYPAVAARCADRSDGGGAPRRLSRFKLQTSQSRSPRDRPAEVPLARMGRLVQ